MDAMNMEAIMPAKRTKTATILKLISRSRGARMDALEKATGWQSHSIRSALTGLRKGGHRIKHDKDANSITVYRISRDVPQ